MDRKLRSQRLDDVENQVRDDKATSLLPRRMEGGYIKEVNGMRAKKM
jgi:hypothetical protein